MGWGKVGRGGVGEVVDVGSRLGVKVSMSEMMGEGGVGGVREGEWGEVCVEVVRAGVNGLPRVRMVGGN